MQQKRLLSSQQLLSDVSDGTKPLYEGVVKNKDKWSDLSKNQTDKG